MPEEVKRGRKPNDPGIPEWNGDALKVRRVLSGFTLKQLGDLIGVGESAISRWELGQRAPDAATVERLAQELKCAKKAFSRPPTLR